MLTEFACRCERLAALLTFALLAALKKRFPLLAKLFVDGAYEGPLFRKALAQVRPRFAIEVVTRSNQSNGFVVLPQRWLVERTMAWLNRCQRLAKAFENYLPCVGVRAPRLHSPDVAYTGESFLHFSHRLSEF